MAIYTRAARFRSFPLDRRFPRDAGDRDDEIIRLFFDNGRARRRNCDCLMWLNGLSLYVNGTHTRCGRTETRAPKENKR